MRVWARRASGAIPAAAWMLLPVVVAGCYHILQPIKPPVLLIEEVSPFPPHPSLLLENGYSAPEPRRVRSDGIHNLDTDLRDWTARLVVELRDEMEKRGATVVIDDASLAGTSLAPLPGAPPEPPRAQGPRRTFRLWITELGGPGEGGAGVHLGARVAEADGPFTATYVSLPGASGFAEALLGLKKSILTDPGLRKALGNQDKE